MTQETAISLSSTPFVKLPFPPPPPQSQPVSAIPPCSEACSTVKKKISIIKTNFRIFI